MSDYVYILLKEHSDWEDTIVYTEKDVAIRMSKKYPLQRVEIFKDDKNGGYIPSYNYYQNGIYYDGNN